MTPVPAVRVVCVTYRPGPELEEFVTSLATAGTGEVELVVVENGPDPAVARAAVERLGGRVIAPGENLGYGRAANLGAAGAHQPWIVVVNPDVVWEPGALDELLAAGEATDSAGALGPLILDPDGTGYPSARALPSLTTGVGHALFSRIWPANPWTRRYRSEGEAGVRRPTGWLSGACLMLRREAFEAVGGFDPAYFMFFEDVDLGERLGRAGWVNLYVPTAQVTHVGGTSWRARPEAMIREHHASAARYLSRRYDRWYQAPVRWVVRAGLALRRSIELRAAR